MHVSNLLLPLLTLSIATPAVTALHITPHHKKALSTPSGKIQEAKREQNLVSNGGKNKVKRLVKKKKRGTCQVHVNATQIITSPSNEATATASVTLPNQENWANATTSSQLPTSTSAAGGASPPKSTSSWFKVEEWSGNSFFDNVNFWEWNDPTHGTVDYVPRNQAWDDGLISINKNNRAVLSVDTTQVVSGGRKSVRVHGNRVYTGGLVLFDAYHMPAGCGAWPAWWSNGPNWPEGGEIDIFEGVNDFTQNQVSLHTGNGCTMPRNLNDNQVGQLTTGGFDSYNCASYATSNQGCGVREPQTTNAYGKPFNDIGGGVYAMRWSKAGITVWFFPRYAIPDDINNDSPDPNAWGKPMAHFPSDNCSPYQFFYDHFNIINTSLCGDWAGADGVWKYGGYAGQDQSCAAITGYQSCSDYVLNSGSSFADAFWEISYVKYFNSTSEV